MYLAVILLVIISQVHYSFGAAECHDWTEDRVAAVKAKVVDVSIDELLGKFDNAYVPIWVDDNIACSGLKNVKKDGHFESQVLMISQNGLQDPQKPPERCELVENGIVEDTDPSTGNVVRKTFIVYNKGGVAAAVYCYTSEEGIKKHSVESGGVTVREDLDWDKPEVKGCIDEAKTKLDEINIDSKPLPKCAAIESALMPEH